MTKAKIQQILGLAAVIFMHGFLHNTISNNKCRPVGPDGGSIAANVVYAVFTAGISYLAIDMVDVGAAATALVYSHGLFVSTSTGVICLTNFHDYAIIGVFRWSGCKAW